MALHPDLLQGSGNDYVYLAFTHAADAGSAGTSTTGQGAAAERHVTIRRYTYDPESATLIDPVDILADLPGSGDHNSGKFVFAADETLFYVIGDQGYNQFGSACMQILAQVFPTAAEISASDWSKYPGKVLRLNLDGSIPDDNPTFNGVQSHIYSYGHRNVQGLVQGPEGQLYAAEHGPKSDDEINLIQAGKNYGWPHVAGFQDDQAYVYGNWSAAPDCARLHYSDFEIPDSVPQEQESEWSNADFTPPLYTFGTVPTGYDFEPDPCAPNYYICWPTVAPTGIEIYAAPAGGIPDWSTSLLVTALKTGRVYRLELDEAGRAIVGHAIPYFETINRYRDLVIHPNGRTFYVITDSGNSTQDASGLPTNELENPGAILEFSYTDE
jgi:PQQ-dependent dehydrogenase (s-GDH family)